MSPLPLGSIRCIAFSFSRGALAWETLALLSLAAASVGKLEPQTMSALHPLGLGRLVLVLPDGSRLDVDDLDAEALEPLQNRLGEIRARKKQRSNGGAA